MPEAEIVPSVIPRSQRHRRLRSKRAIHGKTALVLAGGGITGGIYQLGALRALDDLLLNRTVLDFDLYIGTSAGAFVSTFLAAGIPPRALVDVARNPTLRFQWQLLSHLFSPNLAEVRDRIIALPGHVPGLLADLVRHRGSFLLSDAWGFLSLALPSGLLDSGRVAEFMAELLRLADLPSTFEALERELYVVACQLDSWERTVFGRETRPAVGIPEAVAASTAIPILFKPVNINGVDYVDGGVKGHAAVDVAIDHGANLVVVVNALAPLDARAARNPNFLHRYGQSIADLGIRGVLNQVSRGMLRDALADHIRLLRTRHPEVDIVVIQPLPDDEKMFFHEVMSTSARLVVAQHGYESVLDGLVRGHSHFSEVLGRHGMEIASEVLDAKPWSVPVGPFDPGELRHRMDRTVFGGGRQAGDARRAKRLAAAIDRMESQPPGAATRDGESPPRILVTPAATAPAAPRRRARTGGKPKSTPKRSKTRPRLRPPG
jgi:predicted acylesterase/phospholipase RssA